MRQPIPNSSTFQAGGYGTDRKTQWRHEASVFRTSVRNEIAADAWENHTVCQAGWKKNIAQNKFTAARMKTR
jgi:hypothetical protein